MSIYQDLLPYSATIKFILITPLLAISLQTVIAKHYVLMIGLLGMSMLTAIAYPDSFNSIYSYRLLGFILIFFIVYESLAGVKINDLITCIFYVISIATAGTVISAIAGEKSVYSAEGFGGGSGGFLSANEYSYYLIFLVSIVLIYMALNNKSQKLGTYLFFIASISNCFLLTTKSSMLFATISLLILAFRRWWLISISVFALIILLIINFYEHVSAINRILFFIEKYDILWALTSGRSERFEEFDWKFFGLIPDENVGINFEMELFDAIINLGFCGLIFYFSFLVFAIRKSAFDCLLFAITALIVLIINLSGHFFNSIAIAPYVAAYFWLLNELREKKIARRDMGC